MLGWKASAGALWTPSLEVNLGGILFAILFILALQIVEREAEESEGEQKKKKIFFFLVSLKCTVQF